MEQEVGKVFLVGAGPGRLELITLRGKECIEEADVVIYDYLSNDEMLSWAKPEAELIYAGKKAKNHAVSQTGINDLLLDHAREGKVVCRLKGGDPMMFGRGGEEAEELQAAGIPFEIVPGISSTIAGPMYAGIPVTHREDCSQLTIFTGHENPEKGESSLHFAKLAQADGTKVMLMGVERLGPITESLMEEGMSGETPIALVRWATTGRQETLTGIVSDIAQKVKDRGFKAPAVAIFGEVVHRRERLNWFEERPLFGKRVVVTRTKKQAGKLSRDLREKGADVLEMPTIRIEPPKDMREFGQMVIDAHGYDWLLFSSPNAVESFFETFFKAYHDAREIGGVRIAAIGPGTAAKVAEYRLSVDFVPQTAVAETFADEFVEEEGTVENQRLLWVRGEQARDVLSKKFTEGGAILDEAIAYRTVPETGDRTGSVARFREEGADVITFTSGSTVEHFLDLRLPLPENLKIVSIGPITSQALRDHGLYVDAEAEKADLRSLIDAVEKVCGVGS